MLAEDPAGRDGRIRRGRNLGQLAVWSEVAEGDYLVDGGQALGLPSDARRLSGRVAMVTGNGSGIGLATATEFCGRGAAALLADVQLQLEAISS
jgi:hypothetical protein